MVFGASSGGTAVSFGGGPGGLRRGRGQVDRRSAEAGRRGEEDFDQAVLLRGKVLHVHIITECQRTARKAFKGTGHPHVKKKSQELNALQIKNTSLSI